MDNNNKMYAHLRLLEYRNHKMKEAYDKMRQTFAHFRLKTRVNEFEEEFDSDEWKCYMDSVGFDWSVYY